MGYISEDACLVVRLRACASQEQLGAGGNGCLESSTCTCKVRSPRMEREQHGHSSREHTMLKIQERKGAQQSWRKYGQGVEGGSGEAV